MTAPFLVYELEPDQPTWGKRGRWSSEEDPDLPVRLKANPIGCFVAANSSDACRKAAQVEQRAGNFLAVKGDFHKIDFTATTDPKALEDLATPPKKHFYCCHGHFCCEEHPPARRGGGGSGGGAGGEGFGDSAESGAFPGAAGASILEQSKPAAPKGARRGKRKP